MIILWEGEEEKALLILREGEEEKSDDPMGGGRGGEFRVNPMRGGRGGASHRHFYHGTAVPSTSSIINSLLLLLLVRVLYHAVNGRLILIFFTLSV